MTRWTEAPRAGRGRGPAGMARAWIAVLSRPRSFFETRVVPGDQAPGLTFAMGVVLVEEATRVVLVDGAVPPIAGGALPSALLALGVAVFLVTPAALHLVAALGTLGLILVAEDRAGVSETVQAIGYAVAPCAFAGIPVPALRVACAGYGTALLVVGFASVHRLGYGRAAAAAALPAALVFGYGFRGFAALAMLLSG